MTLELSRRALNDLDAISDFTAERWGTAQSAHYVATLYAACERLARNPGIGRSRAGIAPNRLTYSVGRHVIVYEATARGTGIEVLRILHQKMDIAARLATERNR